jgi:hypothetical protein
MTLLTTIPLHPIDGARTATLPTCPWLAHLSVLTIDSAASLTTGDYESCALVLGGTFDLVGGGTAWPARGARASRADARRAAVHGHRARSQRVFSIRRVLDSHEAIPAAAVVLAVPQHLRGRRNRQPRRWTHAQTLGSYIGQACAVMPY